MSRCTACGTAGTSPDPFYYLWRERRFDIHRCPSCSHQFVFPSITPEDQALMYGDHYFTALGHWAGGFFQGQGYQDAETKLRAEARQILAMLPRCARLLDIGCAGGIFLDEARTREIQVAGIELNPAQAQAARDRFQLEIVTGRIEDIPRSAFEPGGFDGITLLDCLEHIPEPLAALSKAASWLAAGGFIFIRGPLHNSRLARVKELVRRWIKLEKRLPGYPLDANMFNRNSMSAMLGAAGFHPPEWIGLSAGFSNLVATKADPPLSGVLQ